MCALSWALLSLPAKSAACRFALQLVDLFGSTRDEWMASDMQGWLAPNRIYPGVADAVREFMQHDECYIVTTKQVWQCILPALRSCMA
jgi:hypothetical protein